MTLGKYLAAALLAGTVVLAVTSCELKRSEPHIVMKILAPFNGQHLPSGSISIAVRVTNDGATIDSVVLSIDAAHFGTDHRLGHDEDTYRFTWDASSATRGVDHRITAMTCWNKKPKSDFEFCDSSSVTVQIDTGGPAIRIVSPKAGETLAKGDVPVTAWAKDNSGAGMSRVEFLVDGVLKGRDTADTGDTWCCTWDASLETSGTGHTVKAKAYNQQGVTALDSVAVLIRPDTTHGGPTYHLGPITSDKTWSPDGNPHIVSNVSIQDNALVTIMPGCTVKVNTGWGLTVGEGSAGGLQAVGTIAAPILFTSNAPSPAPGDWPGITLDSGTTFATQFRYCTFEYGSSYRSGGNIMVFKNSAASLENCLVWNGAGAGIWCQSGWFSSFQNNTVRANVTYPIAVTPDLVPAIDPDNDLSGNGVNAILIGVYGDVTASTTWPAQSVPYVLDGDIVADGSLGRIVFTADTNPPAWGEFTGIRIGSGQTGDTLSNTRLINCTIEYGGVTYSPGFDGDIVVASTRPTIQNCDIDHGCGCGIVLRGRQVPDTATLHSNNSFANNDSGDIRWYPSKSSSERPRRFVRAPSHN